MIKAINNSTIDKNSNGYRILIKRMEGKGLHAFTFQEEP
jgi:hypothetical protein